MSIIQKNIYIGANATGATLTFGLSGGVDISGYQQEIDGITEKKKQELVNPIEDFEIVRFSPNLTKRLRFYFLNVGNTSYANSFTNAGFTSSELSNRDDVVRNSFIIADLYDTYIPNTQTRLATTYQTKIGATPDYSLKTDLNHQLCAINFPKWYLDTLTDSFVVAYMKLSFYNAKDGKLLLFYNYSIYDISNPENMYFEVYLYPLSKTWEFIADTNAYELTPNSAYVQRNNETFQNFENKKQTYPDGNVFEDDGTYDII
jgi:hypothetical protein